MEVVYKQIKCMDIFYIIEPIKRVYSSFLNLCKIYSPGMAGSESLLNFI